MPAGAFAQRHGAVVTGVAARAHQGDVVHHRFRHRLGVVLAAVVVRLEGVVAAVRVLLGNQELHPAAPAPVPVQRIVAGAGDQNVAQVRGATEHFHAVVQRAVHLHMADNGAAAATAQGQAVEFVVGVHLEAGELDARVLQHAATAVGVVAAEGATGIVGRHPFDVRVGLIHRRRAEQHHAAPVAGGAGALRLAAGEHDRHIGVAGGVQAGVPRHHQGRPRPPFNAGTRLDGQACAVLHIDDAVQHPGAVGGPAVFAGERAGHHLAAGEQAADGRLQQHPGGDHPHQHQRAQAQPP